MNRNLAQTFLMLSPLVLSLFSFPPLLVEDCLAIRWLLVQHLLQDTHTLWYLLGVV